MGAMICEDICLWFCDSPLPPGCISSFLRPVLDPRRLGPTECRPQPSLQMPLWALTRTLDFSEASKAPKSQTLKRCSLKCALLSVSLRRGVLLACFNQGIRVRAFNACSLSALGCFQFRLQPCQGKDIRGGCSRAPALPGLTCPSSPRDGGGFTQLLVSGCPNFPPWFPYPCLHFYE